MSRREWIGAAIVSVKPISGKETCIVAETPEAAERETMQAKRYEWRFAYRVNVYLRGPLVALAGPMGCSR